MSDEPNDEEGASDFLNNLNTYRASLIAAEQAMQASYDKGLMTLSGGALAISFAFIKEVVGKESIVHPVLLLGAWSAWGVSITFVLASFFTSAKALRKAVEDNDLHTIYMTLANSGWSTATKLLNGAAGAAFAIGVASLIGFVSFNLPHTK